MTGQELAELEKLEIRKRALVKEVDALTLKAKAIDSAIKEKELISKEVTNVFYELDKERESRERLIAKRNDELKAINSGLDERTRTIREILGKELTDMTNKIDSAEEEFKQKKISYADYEAGLKKKELELSTKTLELIAKEQELDSEEYKIISDSRINEELAAALAKWNEELEEHMIEVEHKSQSLTQKEQSLQIDATDFDFKANVFIDKASEWHKKIEEKREILLAVGSILGKRDEMFDLRNEQLDSKRQKINDEQISLNMAWKEVKKLQQELKESK